jgi:starch synthase
MLCRGDKPIVAIISRLTAQKGIDLIKHCAGHAKFKGAQFVLLGSAPDPKIQGSFNDLANSVRVRTSTLGLRAGF